MDIEKVIVKTVLTVIKCDLKYFGKQQQSLINVLTLGPRETDKIN
jgi:hypothetical protein